MKEYKVVNIEGQEYKVNEDNRVLHPKLTDRYLRSDSNAYKEVFNRIEKEEYHIVKEPEWEDYGNPIHLEDEERKRLKKLLVKKMTLNQKRFLEEYVLGEYAGNQARSYAKAYNKLEDLEAGKVGLVNLSSAASYALRLPYNQKYLQIVLKEAGYDATSIDVRLNQLAWQNDDKRVALEAIKEINKLHGRITKKLEVSGNINHTHQPMDLSKLEDEELEQLYNITKKLKDDRDNEVKVVE